MGGRGPTRLISPRSTLNNCGSSSRLVLRIQLPLRVMRGSRLSLRLASAPGAPAGNWSSLTFCWIRRVTCAWCRPGSASTTIERNLSMVNGCPFSPMRFCRYSTGPGDSSRMAMAMAAISGDTSTSPTADSTTPKARLEWRRQPWMPGWPGPHHKQMPPIEMRARAAPDTIGQEGDANAAQTDHVQHKENQEQDARGVAKSEKQRAGQRERGHPHGQENIEQLGLQGGVA